MISDTNDKTFSHHTAEVNEVRLHYVIGGRGDPVVLLHGWPLTWYHWRKIMPALVEHYTVIAPDLRGLSESSKPATGYDKQTVADDIYKLVHQLGFQRIFLVGHDWGAAVAYAYAAAHRQDVRRLVYIEMPLPGFGLNQEIKLGEYWQASFHLVPEIPEALVAGRERIYLSWFFKNLSYNKAAITEADIDEYVRSYSTPESLRAGFEYYRALFEDIAHNQESAKTKLKMPVLALGGESVLGVRAIQSMQAVAEDVRGEVVERCGHFIAEERPEYLIQQLLTFFSEERSTRTLGDVV